MAQNKILLIGARGHARAVADVVKAENRYQIAGLIDSFQEPGVVCFGYKLLGGEKDVPKICDELDIRHIFVAIGDNFQRRAMAERLRKVFPELHLIPAIHPSAVIGSGVEIGEGTAIMPHVTVVSGCKIAEGCLLNTASSLDHDSIMEAWSALGPGVVTGGCVRIGARSTIGLGAKLRNKVRIGGDSVIGMGAVVTKDIPGNVLAYGAPCRIIRSRRPDEPYL